MVKGFEKYLLHRSTIGGQFPVLDLEKFCPVLLADGQRKSVRCEHAVLTDDLHPETPGCRLMGKLSLFHCSNDFIYS